MKKILVCIAVIVALVFVMGVANPMDALTNCTGSLNTGGSSPPSSSSATPEPAPTPTPEPTPQPTPTVEPWVNPTSWPTPQPQPSPTPYVQLYSQEWLDIYAPASVASFEEQVGDNGDYDDPVRPPAGTYSLVVDYTNQCVYAYEETGGIPKLVRVMICTTGGNGNWTPEGVYDMGSDYHRFGFFTSFNCYAQYWTQMSGSFYFHSLLYNARDASTYTMSSYNNLGKPGSHGCIRLLVPDARWIYENCAPGTKCEVTTAFYKKEDMKNALKYGYEGAVDYIDPDSKAEETESGDIAA